MDQSFGIQAVCVRELVESAEPRSANASGDEPRASDEYGPGVHDVPDDLDKEIAEIKLAAEGVEFDSLTDTQREYMGSWDHGT